jgi:hypothetical protein
MQRYKLAMLKNYESTKRLFSTFVVEILFFKLRKIWSNKPALIFYLSLRAIQENIVARCSTWTSATSSVASHFNMIPVKNIFIQAV